MAQFSLMNDLVIVGGLTAAALVGRFLPRLSAYVLGPGILMTALWYAGSILKNGFGPQASVGGFAILFFLIFVFGAACVAGFLLIAGGLKQIDREAGREPARPQHLREDSVEEKKFLEDQRRVAEGLIRLQADREKQKNKDAA